MYPTTISSLLGNVLGVTLIRSPLM